MPGEIAALRAPGTPGTEQMLYRFRNAGTRLRPSARMPPRSGGAAVRRGDRRAVLPDRPRAGDVGRSRPFVPFLVAFGVIGLVMSVLIVTNVVSGAVVPGYRRIGILKSIGFTPGQVVARLYGAGRRFPPWPACWPAWCSATCWP